MRSVIVVLIVIVSAVALDLILIDIDKQSVGQEDLATPEQLKSETSEHFLPRRRTKRSTFSIPPNTSVRITLDLSTAVNPLKNTGTYLTVDLPFRFVLPTHKDAVSTGGKFELNDDGNNELEKRWEDDYHFLEEQRANSQRRNIYKHIETALNKFGINGELCLRRTICELAESPLFGHHGLIGKLITLIFSPSILEIPEGMKSALSNPDDNRVLRDSVFSAEERELLDHPVEDQYTNAYRDGKAKLCWARYSGCPISVLSLFDF